PRSASGRRRSSSGAARSGRPARRRRERWRAARPTGRRGRPPTSTSRPARTCATRAPSKTLRRRRVTPPGRGRAGGNPGAAGPRRPAPATAVRPSPPRPKAILGRMSDTLRVACVQMTSGPDKAGNLELAESLVDDAAAAGADLVVLPEKWNAIGPPD